MKPIVWEEINDKPANFTDLESGAYVLKVVDAKEELNQSSQWDKVRYDSITIGFDVAEGGDTDFFARNNKPDFTHEHEFKVVDDAAFGQLGSDEKWKYTAWADKFLPAIKASNPNLSGISDVKQLVGCRFGAVVRHRQYTKSNGDDGNTLEIQAFYAAQDIRDGNYSPAKDLDKRKGATAKQAAPAAASPAPAAYDDSDIPF